MTRGKQNPLALPFDQYQRYRLVADLLAELRRATGHKAPLAVLDVGGRTALLRRFLERERITLVDLEPSPEAGLVLGDGARLPFQGASFDVVTAFDTLEHVPPAQRQAFVAECCRVARSWVVLAGPYDSPRVAEAEELLKRFLGEKLGVEHRYLNEHRAHGLPDRAAVEAQLAALGGEVASIGHANLDRWLVTMCLSMYMDADPALRPLAEAFHRFYNASLYASDHAAPVYRHAVVAAFQGVQLPDAARLLDPPAAPRGTLEGLRDLALELATFDRERGEWRAERERLRRVAADLERDLAGHRASLTGAREEARELSEVKEALARDLAGHQATLKAARAQARRLTETKETLARDLAGHQATLKEAREELRQLTEVKETLAQDLAGHQATLAEAREELRARAEALGQMGMELERERRLGEESRQALARDLAEHKKVLASQGAELALQRAAYAELCAASEGERRAEGQARADLERDLAGHREVLAARERERTEVLAGLAALETARADERAASAKRAELEEGHRQALAELRAELAGRDARWTRLSDELREEQRLHRELAGEIGRLRAELHDRWKSLRRALGRRNEL